MNFSVNVAIVIPAQAGIQATEEILDSRLRGNDNGEAFFKGLREGMRNLDILAGIPTDTFCFLTGTVIALPHLRFYFPGGKGIDRHTE